MKLTRVLKAKVEKELNAKRLELNKQGRQDYYDKQEKASKEIKEYLITVTTTEIQKILAKYNMDTDKVMTEHEYYNEVLCYRPHQIKNTKELEKISQNENDRYHKAKEIIEDFQIECELGVEKDQFFEALANLCAKFENEAK